MIYLKISEQKNIIKIISIIRKYDKKLSISEIKEKLKNKDIIITHNIYESINTYDDLNNIDNNQNFCNLINEFFNNAIEIELYDNNVRITKEFLFNEIIKWKEICDQTKIDIDNETN